MNITSLKQMASGRNLLGWSNIQGGHGSHEKTSSILKQFLSVLKKPQIKHFLVYQAGLIWLIKFHSTREIATQMARRLPDNLQRFLNGSSKKPKRLQETNENLLAQKANKQPEVVVAIDDTTCPRDGKKIESKIQLAQEILQRLRQKIHTSVTVLMDSWYTCAPILIPIIEAGAGRLLRRSNAIESWK